MTDHEIQGWENCPFALKWNFLRKLTDTTVYLFCPIMLQCLKKIFPVEQIMRYKVSQFWAKLGLNCIFPLKGDFID